ncbi:MAG: hypothetical protein A2V66_04625 [Ignavibacteria bacterium RBG_13_36_8]|nr:MAG: hypothetical protein A2V66_04625 [Ignavibacteria bacterium RBG_13_36_8]
MKTQSSIKSLVELGLTELESQIYAYLLENSPATGYGVAKGIGKPTANAYKGLESLLAKGAIVVEGGASRLFRAIPSKELLNGLEIRFRKLKEEAEEELSKLKPIEFDERVYHLTSPQQVFERFKEMLAKSTTIVLLDLFPAVVDEIREDLKLAIARKVKVAIKLYESDNIDGAFVIVDPQGPDIIERWPGLWANGVIDGKEHLLTFMSSDKKRVHQAVWSSNTYISWIYHSALMFELLHTSISSEVKSLDTDLPEIYSKILALKGQYAPGYDLLLNRFKVT